MQYNRIRAIKSTIVLFSVIMGISGCLDTLSEPTPSPVFDGEEALRHVENQMAFGPRPTGSDASRATGEYILETLSANGWVAESQPFDYRDTQAQNIIGRSGNTEKPLFLLGAHYDTRRVADQDSASPDQPVLGANDGASGVAVLLELARVLDLSKVNGDVWLVFFDAEDNGRLDDWDWIVGSSYFAEHLVVPVTYVIIVDMIGDSDQNIYYEGNSDVMLREKIWNTADDLGFSDYFVPEVYHSMLDDHTPFLAKGIPAVDIIDFDYPFWHTTEDTVDKVSIASLFRVGRVLEEFLEQGGDYPSAD